MKESKHTIGHEISRNTTEQIKIRCTMKNKKNYSSIKKTYNTNFVDIKAFYSVWNNGL